MFTSPNYRLKWCCLFQYQISNKKTQCKGTQQVGENQWLLHNESMIHNGIEKWWHKIPNSQSKLYMFIYWRKITNYLVGTILEQIFSVLSVKSFCVLIIETYRPYGGFINKVNIIYHRTYITDRAGPACNFGCFEKSSLQKIELRYSFLCFYYYLHFSSRNFLLNFT